MTNVRQLFGTDGIRGRANEYPMTVEMMLRLGKVLATQIRRGKLGRVAQNVHHRPRVVIGKDTRLSGYMIEQALGAGICSMGVDVIFVGPLPTPGIAFITQNLRADAGVVVSASHNPFDDNGVKIFGHDGYKLPDAVENEFESMLLQPQFDTESVVGPHIGRAKRIDDAQGRYAVFAKSTFPSELTLEGMHIVVDCAHGAAYKIAPELFRELGARVTVLGCEPNGLNINDQCGSLHPQKMADTVVAHHADIGIALDGDADRVMVVDHLGSIVDGDALMAVCALEMQQKGQLAYNTLVATVMSNLGLERALKNHGIVVERTQVGDRYVMEKMRSGGYTLGGEQSGHVIFAQHGTTGDGLVAALALLAAAVREKTSIHQLTHIFTPVPQTLLNIAVKHKKPLESLPSVQSLIRSIEQGWSGEGRVLVRYSGTENKARIMIEGPDADRIKHEAQQIADALLAALV